MLKCSPGIPHHYCSSIGCRLESEIPGKQSKKGNTAIIILFNSLWLGVAAGGVGSGDDDKISS